VLQEALESADGGLYFGADNTLAAASFFQARTELCTQGGNKLRGAKGMANCRP